MKRTTQVIINTVGTYGNIGFSFLQTLIQFNTMSRAEFGIISVLLGIAYLLTNVFDFGTVATTYAQVPKLKEENRKRLPIFAKSIWSFQTTLATSALIVLFFLFPLLDRYLLKLNASTASYFLTCLSILLLVWQNIISNMLFAAKHFVAANVSMNISHVVKLGLIYGAYLTHTITIEHMLLIIGVIGPIIFFIGTFLFHQKAFLHTFIAKGTKEFLHLRYTLTYFLSTQIYTFGSRMDLFFMSYFFPKDIVGNYALAQRMMTAASSTIVSITQVLSPQYATISSKKEALKEFAKSFKFLLIPAALFIGVMIAPSFVFHVFKQITDQTILLTRLFAIPYLILTFGSVPYLFTLYTKKRADQVLMSNILFLLVGATTMYLTIPVIGVLGGIAGLFAAYIASNSYVTWFTIKELPKLAKK